MTGAFTSDAAYQDLAASLDPVAVSQYLAATHAWQLEARDGDIREIWSLPGGDGELKGRIMLPLGTNYVDFQDRFSDTLIAIGDINGWSAAEVRERITAARADMLLVRLDQLVVSAEVDGRRRNVHMVLAGSAHDLAIRSYQSKRPLIVSDDLVFERRAWRLTGEVEVDARLLERPD